MNTVFDATVSKPTLYSPTSMCEFEEPSIDKPFPVNELAVTVLLALIIEDVN